MKYGQEWAETLILRILNDLTYSDEFVKVISNLDKANKSAVINLLEKIKTTIMMMTVKQRRNL